jgi:hypothetical protein
VQEVEATLERLMERSDGPFVARLPRQPGRRESRYAHLFSGDVEAMEMADESDRGVPLANLDRERLERLERQVAELVREIEELKSRS